MKRSNVNILFILLLATFSIVWISCGGGGGGGSSSSSGSGTVALYATDSPDDEYTQVILTINSISLLHTGSGESCSVLTTPVTLDISDLSSVIELLSITTCPAENYNRIHIELGRQATLTDTGTPPVTADCTLGSYKDWNNHSNTLDCSGDTCTIDITGAVNVLKNADNELALDFELKDFEVDDFNTPDCSVTMKVSPLNSSEIEDKHDGEYKDELSGKISGLDTEADSFTITSKKHEYSISYSGAAGTGIDDILTLALDNDLKVRVEIGSIDLAARTVEASSVSVKIEGTVSVLNETEKTFTLNSDSTNIVIDYNAAEKVEGTLADAVIVEVLLDGYDSGSNMYSAHKIEVGDADDETDDDDD